MPLPERTLDRTTRAYVKRINAGSRSSFYWAMRLLPADQRNGIFAVYAYCRQIDDIVDTPGEGASKLHRLQQWRQSVRALCDHGNALPEGPGEVPFFRALKWAIDRFDLPEKLLQELISGMEMDISGTMQAPDWATLRLYNYRAAGVVGLLSIRIFGDASKQAHDFAVVLADAMQLTNILRDLNEDASLGRLYLPAEELDAHGLPTAPIEAVLTHVRLNRVCRAVAVVAEEKYAEAERLLGMCDRRALRPARIMMQLYRRILANLVAGDWQDVDRNVALTRWEKFRIIGAAILAG